ncbi:hypothetical protein KEM52_005941 [Ascosphaera acerosa]|nr:hypothetical protein KEM52_005941 [Ascosphaera acerosa]
MATLAAEPLAARSGGNGSHPSSSFEHVDYDVFINYDQPVYPSPSVSLSAEPSEANASQQSLPPPCPPSGGVNQSVTAPSGLVPGQGPTESTDDPSAHTSMAAQQQSLHDAKTVSTCAADSSSNFIAVPAHEYEQFKQQTGLPPGALANTIALNMPQSVSAVGAHAHHVGLGSEDLSFHHFPGSNLTDYSGYQYAGVGSMGFPANSATFLPLATGPLDPTSVSMATTQHTPGSRLEASASMPAIALNGQEVPSMTARDTNHQPGQQRQQQQQQQQQLLLQQQQQQQHHQQQQQHFSLASQGSWPFDVTAHQSQEDAPQFTPCDVDSTAALLATNLKSGRYVDPAAISANGSRADPSSGVAPGAQTGRMYPGIHSQQAAMAKAAAEQRRALAIAAQQRQLTHRFQDISGASLTPQAAGQMQLPLAQLREATQASDLRVKPSISFAPDRTDPDVQNRINRILASMRQPAATICDPAALPTAKPTPLHITRTKKDEDEMDEDERLLASEEGKKLSSRERRQLRNKVSARAFRSRRKEYIGQLEGEVTAKTNEANDLRMQNSALAEENARLMEFTRMLLSSPHFAHVLREYGDALTGYLNPSQQRQPSQQSRRGDPCDSHTYQQPTAAVNSEIKVAQPGQSLPVTTLDPRPHVKQSAVGASEGEPQQSYDFAAPPTQTAQQWSATSRTARNPAMPADVRVSDATAHHSSSAMYQNESSYQGNDLSRDSNTARFTSSMPYQPDCLHDNGLPTTMNTAVNAIGDRAS